jgi:hypothetical protein
MSKTFGPEISCDQDDNHKIQPGLRHTQSRAEGELWITRLAVSFTVCPSPSLVGR